MNTKSSNLFKGVSWVIASSIIGNILQFLLIFVLLKFYTQEEFGLWASVTSIAAVIITGDFGIVNVLRNIISREIVNGEKGLETSKQYFYSAFIFFITLAVLLSMVLLVLSKYIPFEDLFKTNNDYLKQQGRSIFLIVQFIFLFNIPFGMGIPLFFSFGESKSYSLINSLKSVFSFLMVFCLAITNINIGTVAIFYFLSNLLISILGTIYFIYKRKWFSYHFYFKDSFLKLKEMLSVGVKFLSIQFFSSFLQNVLTIYSGSMVGLSVAANINIVQKIFTFFGNIYQSAFNPLWSELAVAFQKRNFNWCWTLLTKSVWITIVFFSFIITSIAILGDYMIKYIIGEDFESNISILILVGILFAIKIVFDNFSLLQNATNKLNVLIYGYIVMFLYSVFIIPYILKYFGIQIMIINLIILWLIFIVIIYFDLRRIINMKKNLL